MANPAGESNDEALRLDFNRRVKLEFYGSAVTSDAGLLTYRELDDVLGLMTIAGQQLTDGRTGKNGRHVLIGMLRQSVFGRLAGYEDVNDADRLGRDPVMRWIVGGKAAQGTAASTSQMGRFETEWLANDANFTALADLSGRWIDRVHSRRPAKGIVLDMDSSVTTATRKAPPITATSPAPAIIRCSCSTSSAIWNAPRCVRAMSTRRTVGRKCWSRSWPDIGGSSSAATSAPMRPFRILRSTSSWRAKASSTRSVCRPTTCCRSVSATCSRGLLVVLRARSAVLRQLQLSGAKLEDTAPRGGQGRVAPGRALSARRVQCHQPVTPGRTRRRILQSARHGGAVDQGRQERRQVDAAVMLLVRCQRSASSVACAGLQSRQLHADVGSAGGNQAVVADQVAGKTREDRRQGRAPWPLRHIPDGRRRGAEGIVPGNLAADRRTATKTGPKHRTGTVGCIITTGGVRNDEEKGPNRRIKRRFGRRGRRKRWEHCAARLWLPGNAAVCYRPRRSRVHPGNVG
jgi:hypothetical protein